MVGSNFEAKNIGFVVTYQIYVGKFEQAVQLRDQVMNCGHLLDQALEFLLGFFCLKTHIWISAKNLFFCRPLPSQGTGIITENRKQACLKNSDYGVILLLARMLNQMVMMADTAAYTRLVVRLFLVGMGTGIVATNFDGDYLEILFHQ